MAVGTVMEDLEERNEMFETPLIREAADGNSKNVLLLLEAGADVDAQQDNSIGFTALHQAGLCLLSCLFSQFRGRGPPH
jgi:ankyrin repeat protein